MYLAISKLLNSIQSFIFLQQVNAIVRSIQNIEKKGEQRPIKILRLYVPY